MDKVNDEGGTPMGLHNTPVLLDVPITGFGDTEETLAAQATTLSDATEESANNAGTKN